MVLQSQMRFSGLNQIVLIFEIQDRGRPDGTVVKCARSASAAWGSPVRIPGANMALLASQAVAGVPHIK